jgi:hypothetical protein
MLEVEPPEGRMATEIRIALEGRSPPRGVVRVDPRRAGTPPESRPFVGWLGLLRALSDVVDVARDEPG